MENVRKILTPSAVWKDFNSDLPLKESKVNEMTYDGISYVEVYFSGRETESGRVRIYGLYARPQPLPMNRKLGAVLLLPDYKETINLELVNHFAKMGYAVLMVDYRGDVGESTNHTNYPTEIDYANYGKEDMFRVERTAKETCWYEWVAVGKYALSYLKSRPEVDKIGVVGIKQGANVAWQLLYNETRVSCFVPIFGMGWQAYKNLFKCESGDITMDDERYRWLGGVDAHVYAQYCQCPVLYLAGTNNSDFDCERGVDTLARVSKEIKCSFNYTPRFRDAINKKSADDIALFLKKYLTKAGAASDRLYFPESPTVTLAFSEDFRSVFAEVSTDETDKLKSLTLYLSEGIANPSWRNWSVMQPVKNKNTADKKYFKQQLGGGVPFVHVFAVADYKNGVSVSSRIVYKKLEKPSPVTLANMLYSSRNGVDCFTVYDEKSTSIGKILFCENGGIELAECANSITGATSRYGLLNYRISENRFTPNLRSIIKFDVYCEDYTALNFSVMIDEGGVLVPYSSKVELKGSKVWQKVQIDFASFKNEQRMSIKNYEKIVAVKIDAESRFAVNNLLLI